MTKEPRYFDGRFNFLHGTKIKFRSKKFGFPLTTKQATEFVELFGFIVEVDSSTHFLEEKLQPPKREDKVFIVPPMLPWNFPEAATKLPADKNENVCIVYYNFPDHFIPPHACCLYQQKYQTK